jgi:hypothetical protein
MCDHNVKRGSYKINEVIKDYINVSFNDTYKL